MKLKLCRYDEETEANDSFVPTPAVRVSDGKLTASY